MKDGHKIILVFCMLCCLLSASLAETASEQTISPLEASTVEFIFGSDIEAVNHYIRQFMETIGEPESFDSITALRWPVAKGQQEPAWDDFSPHMPHYMPPFLITLQDGEDEKGNQYLRYETELMDLSFEDWTLELTNGGEVLPCEYESPLFYSDWFPAEELDFQGLVLSRRLAPNVCVGFSFSAMGQRTETSVSWEDADYAVEWVWHCEEGWDGADDVNLLSLCWKSSGKTDDMYFDAKDGTMLNAVAVLVLSPTDDDSNGKD